VQDGAGKDLLLREGRPPGDAVHARADDYLGALVYLAVGTVYRPAVGRPLQLIHTAPQEGLQVPVAGVGFVVGQQLLLGYIRRVMGRERRQRQVRQLLDGVQVQAVVVVAPGLGHPPPLLQKYEGDLAGLQLAGYGQSGGACAYDDYRRSVQGRIFLGQHNAHKN
jgi:hypothetical protein